MGGRRAYRRTLDRAPDRVAGVAHNKTLAKLCSGRRKPNLQVHVPWSVGNGSLVVLTARCVRASSCTQTVLPLGAVLDFMRDLPLNKIRFLGGKVGSNVEDMLNIKTVHR